MEAKVGTKPRGDRDTSVTSCHLVSLTSFRRFSRRGRHCRTVSGRFLTDVARSERSTETTTPEQLKPGIARVTNPEEYVQNGENGALRTAEHMVGLV
jgi:hypothetical protein